MLALLSISIPFDPHQPSQNRTIPRSAPPHLPLNERSVGFAVPLPCTITLASPRKRGGGTADIIFWLAVQYSDSPTFTILKLFRAVTVGIVNASEAFMLALLSISISFDPHQPSPNRTIPSSAPHSCLPCQREVLSPEKIRATTGGIASRCTECCHSPNHLKSTTIPSSAPHSFIPFQR